MVYSLNTLFNIFILLTQSSASELTERVVEMRVDELVVGMSDVLNNGES